MELAYTKGAERAERTRAAMASGIVSSRGVCWGRRFNREETLTPERAVPLDAEATIRECFLFIVLFFSSSKPLKEAIRYVHKAESNKNTLVVYLFTRDRLKNIWIFIKILHYIKLGNHNRFIK